MARPAIVLGLGLLLALAIKKLMEDPETQTDEDINNNRKQATVLNMNPEEFKGVR
jgi:hypothetical protein